MREQQFDLFSNIIVTTPCTEGIKYAGSKLKILPHIINVISNLSGVTSVLDGFSGSTRISQALAQLNYKVTSNDISAWSETFARCYLLSNKDDAFYADVISYLNSLRGYDGWFTENYGGDVNGDRKFPFQRKNTQKLDAIRDAIDQLNLDEIDKSVILTSLIYALDKVDSTLGHYVSYLNKWSKRSYDDLVLKLPKRFRHCNEHAVLKKDVMEIVQNNSYDLAYFDPPYGSNNDKMPPSRVRYNSYYHIWTTVINHDKPQLFGKANRRVDSRDGCGCSIFEEYRADKSGAFIAIKAIDSLIAKTDAKYILLSYSSGGRATKEQLFDIIHSHGNLLNILEINHKKSVMANMRWTNEWASQDNKNTEYVFVIAK